MNYISTLNISRCIFASSLLWAAIGAQAQTNNVTFQMDMTKQIQLGRFTNSPDGYVRVAGAFNGWNASIDFTNNPAASGNASNLYSQTLQITGAPGSQPGNYKFRAPIGDTWETISDRLSFTLTGGDQVLPLVYWDNDVPNAPTNNVTFQLDMTTQILLGRFTNAPDGYVRVSGAFNGWSASIDFTNNPAASGSASNIYSQTLQITGFAGSQPGNYKFRAPIGDTWETISDRPSFTLTGGDQVLPLVYWDNAPPNAPTNNVTFQVDMSAQILLGRFTNAPDGYVRVAGAFNGWNASIDFTNNSAASGNASNIYSQTLQIAGFPGSQPGNYKFRAPIGDTWESINDRPSFTLTGGDQVLPLVFYNNASPCDLLATATPVTFTLSITNGTVDKDGFVFNNAVDKLYINGDFLGWWGWNTGFGGSEGPAFELTNNPVGSDLYQQTFLIPRGQSLALTYKYSISGFDNEAGFGLNHVRYIRNSGGAPLAMPQDSFLTNSAAVRTEESFGDLKVGSPSGGNIPITWLGRQCVVLQSRTNLTVGSWQDLPATEATSSTVVPATDSAQFFRLKKSN